MRAAAVMLVLVAGCSSGNGPSDPPLPDGARRVLFIGNSLTNSNDLPGTVAAVAEQGGVTIVPVSHAFGGFGLEEHWNTAGARAHIQAGGWDYVVLQQGPSALESSRVLLIEMTKRFDALIRAHGGKTALYMVWPDTQNFGDFARVGGSYLAAATAVQGLFMPAGLAWMAAWERRGSLALYGNDGFHPSPTGTYLAALVIYERITGKDARDLPDVAIAGGATLGLDGATVALLQDAAHDANTWYQYPWH
jgi:hypothetical protein